MKLSEQVKQIYQEIIAKVFKNGRSSKIDDKIFNQIFGPKASKNSIVLEKDSNCNIDQSIQKVPAKQQQPLMKTSQILLKNPQLNIIKEKNNPIYLRNIISSYFKVQTQKINVINKNYSSSVVQTKASGLLEQLFVKYTTIFDELQISFSQSNNEIKRQPIRNFINNYVELFIALYSKGFRKILTVMKIIIRILRISNYITKESPSIINNLIRSKIGINLHQINTEYDKMCFQLAFKLKKIYPLNFNYQAQIEREQYQHKLTRLNKIKQRQQLQNAIIMKAEKLQANFNLKEIKPQKPLNSSSPISFNDQGIKFITKSQLIPNSSTLEIKTPHLSSNSFKKQNCIQLSLNLKRQIQDKKKNQIQLLNKIKAQSTEKNPIQKQETIKNFKNKIFRKIKNVQNKIIEEKNQINYYKPFINQSHKKSQKYYSTKKQTSLEQMIEIIEIDDEETISIEKTSSTLKKNFHINDSFYQQFLKCQSNSQIENKIGQLSFEKKIQNPFLFGRQLQW